MYKNSKNDTKKTLTTAVVGYGFLEYAG